MDPTASEQDASASDTRLRSTWSKHLLSAPVERMVWAIGAVAPCVFALNILVATRFDLEIAGVLARSSSLSAYVQYGLIFLTLAGTGIGAVIAGTAAGACLRRGRHLLGIVLLILGATLLIPLMTSSAASFEAGVPIVYIVAILGYAATVTAPTNWWKMVDLQENAFAVVQRWWLPTATIATSFLFVVFAPLPSTVVTYGGADYRTYVVSSSNGETLIYNDVTHEFASYSTEKLTQVRPCFSSRRGLVSAWPRRPDPKPICPDVLLPGSS